MEQKTMVTAMSTKTRVEIHSYVDHVMKGTLYNDFLKETKAFHNEMELLNALENVYDTLAFPQKFADYRHFDGIQEKLYTEAEEVEKEMSESTSASKATFVIHVQFRRNSTWQGNIQWVEQNKRQTFRSTLEMIRLMDEAMENEQDVRISWDKEDDAEV